MTENERMATIETELRQINNILGKVDQKLDNMNTAYVPRSEIDEKFKSRDDRIAALESNQTSNKALAPAWIGTVVAIGALLVSLLK